MFKSIGKSLERYTPDCIYHLMVEIGKRNKEEFFYLENLLLGKYMS